MLARVHVGRWLCIFLVLVLVSFSIAACGSNSSPTNPGGNPGTNQSGY